MVANKPASVNPPKGHRPEGEPVPGGPPGTGGSIIP
jgi:hypothetical protein